MAPDDRVFETVDITNEAQAIAALRAAVARAMTTPAGRARLALAAAVAQIDARPTGAAYPADDDVDAQLGGLVTAYNAMLFSRAAIETAAKGNISWNAGVSYAAMFDATGTRARAGRAAVPHGGPTATPNPSWDLIAHATSELHLP